MIYKSIDYAYSRTKSNSFVREIMCDNTQALSDIFKVKDATGNLTSDGYIDLQGVGTADNTKFIYAPFKRIFSTDITNVNDCLFLDNSGIFSVKVDGIVYPIYSKNNIGLVPRVKTLPPTSQISLDYAPIVVHDNNLKWWDLDSSTWKIVTST